MLEPVDVGGVTVSRATLHNADEVARKDVRPGDTVRIARAGDVIPEVVERINKPGRRRSAPFEMPDHCPSCGAEVVREGAYHVCPAGLACPPQLMGHLQHFASESALDIDGLGEETARDLVDRQLVTELADLYRLSFDDLLSLEGFAEKKARKLHEAIQQSAKPRLDRFLFALGIRHVGRHTANVLARHFRTLENVQSANEEELTDIPEIGPRIARSLVHFFRAAEEEGTLRHFREAGVEVQSMPATSGRAPLADKTFVFTGGLEHFTRDEAKQRVEMLGGRATSSVSSQTDYLVAGENPGSKLDEARSENVHILNEDAFERLIST